MLVLGGDHGAAAVAGQQLGGVVQGQGALVKTAYDQTLGSDEREKRFSDGYRVIALIRVSPRPLLDARLPPDELVVSVVDGDGASLGHLVAALSEVQPVDLKDKTQSTMSRQSGSGIISYLGLTHLQR